MAYTGIMTTEAVIDQKTGAGVSASFTDVMKTAATLQGESLVNDVARYNFSDDYAALNADVKHLLDDIVSSFVAIQGISYDMSGYTNPTEAVNMINILRDGMNRNLSVLKEQKVKDFINGA